MSRQRLDVKGYKRPTGKEEVRLVLSEIYVEPTRPEPIESNEGYVLRSEPTRLRFDYREEAINNMDARQ